MFYSVDKGAKFGIFYMFVGFSCRKNVTTFTQLLYLLSHCATGFLSRAFSLVHAVSTSLKKTNDMSNDEIWNILKYFANVVFVLLRQASRLFQEFLTMFR